MIGRFASLKIFAAAAIAARSPRVFGAMRVGGLEVDPREQPARGPTDDLLESRAVAAAAADYQRLLFTVVAVGHSRGPVINIDDGGARAARKS